MEASFNNNEIKLSEIENLKKLAPNNGYNSL